MNQFYRYKVFGAIVVALTMLASSMSMAGPMVPVKVLVKIGILVLTFDNNLVNRIDKTVDIAVFGESNRAKEITVELLTYSRWNVKKRPLRVSQIRSVNELVGKQWAAVIFADDIDGATKSAARKLSNGGVFTIDGVTNGIHKSFAVGVEITDEGKPRLVINQREMNHVGASLDEKILEHARVID